MIALQPSLADGWYRVEWHALSVDGHRIQGVFPFGVGDAGPAPEIGALAGGGAATGSIVLRFVMLSSLILGAGLAAFRLLWCGPADEVRPRALWRMDGILLGLIVLALIATPLYVAHETALFGDRSLLDVGWIAENLRSTAFGRGYTDLVVLIAALRGADGGRPANTAPLAGDRARSWSARVRCWCPGSSGIPARAPCRRSPCRSTGCTCAPPPPGPAACSGWRCRPRRRHADRAALLDPGAAVRDRPRLDGCHRGARERQVDREPDRTGYGRSLIVKSVLLAATMPFALQNLRSSRAGLKLRLPFVRSELSLVTVIIVAAAVLTTLPPPGRGATTQVAAAGAAPIAVQPGSTQPTRTGRSWASPRRRRRWTSARARSTRRCSPPRRTSASSRSTRTSPPGRTTCKCSCPAPTSRSPARRVTATFRHVEDGLEMPVQTIMLPQTAVGVYAASTDALADAGHLGGDGQGRGRRRDRAAAALPREVAPS